MNIPLKFKGDKALFVKIMRFAKTIDEKYPIRFAYLFGSYARGDNHSNSDIDLAFYFDKHYSDIEDAFNRGTIIEDGKEFFNKNVDIISLNKASLLLKHEIIRDGIVVKDFIGRATFESLLMREYFDYKYFSDIYDEKMIKNIKNGNFFEED
ncbi:type VII toxin-antitoxin system MntA family adenylyltransferase antitoxin [Clostridium grantii]|uniref:Predicted nucleotidyltransferase n=1 Tax=Clostridium grantii DSM 8605 TaxID=1121316 RepID=A0A1M5YA26_9CLOT|nr:nucleotidyltransferase domain-containing protein [Clostridium grantii]SHI08678.1 Predicted nucleotidyltransferase [Clostridium grantii DSM 8605]